MSVLDRSDSAERDRAAGDVPLLLSVEEAARLLGIGRTVAYRLLSQGELRSVKVGGRRLIPRVAVEIFIAELLEDSQLGL